MINYLQQPADWQPGIYQISKKQYDDIPALRSTMLKIMVKRSPAHFLWAHQAEREHKRVFDIGNAFDLLILSGKDALDKKVVIEPPNSNRRTKEYQDWKKENKDKIIFSKDEYKTIFDMKMAAFKKVQFSKIFAGHGYSHRVIIWQDVQSKIWCKAEIDWISSRNGVVTDLKTSRNAEFYSFRRDARKLGYFNQGAHYLAGLKSVTGVPHNIFQFAAVEKEPPYESAIYRMSFNQLEQAREENQEALVKIAECLNNNNWPGYPDQIIDLEKGLNYESITPA